MSPDTAFDDAYDRTAKWVAARPAMGVSATDVVSPHDVKRLSPRWQTSVTTTDVGCARDGKWVAPRSKTGALLAAFFRPPQPALLTPVRRAGVSSPNWPGESQQIEHRLLFGQGRRRGVFVEFAGG